MTNHSEIKNIIQESVSQILEEKSRDKKNKVIEIMGVILTPVVIASVSLLVTYEINKSQAINARTIANAQIESAKSMAEAQRDHTARLAEAELEVQRLKQIDNIFQKIIKNGKSSVDTETKKMLIGSLTTHRETSLPFLVRIRDHFAGQEGDSGELSMYARDIIEAILTNKHLDFVEMDFSIKGELRILRYAKLQDYNLSGVKFDNCNLFQAKFTRSTLSNSSFRGADLFGADFSDTKLDGANFEMANLRKATFIGSKIEGAHFESAKNLEDASFSLTAILKNYQGRSPFDRVKNDTMLKLLIKHIDELKKMDPDDSTLLVFLQRFEKIVTYQDLLF
jgi:hypothetical protein